MAGGRKDKICLLELRLWHHSQRYRHSSPGYLSAQSYRMPSCKGARWVKVALKLGNCRSCGEMGTKKKDAIETEEKS